MALRTNISRVEVLMSETCCSCGVLFGMAETLYDARKRDGDSFYCPNGHGQHYSQHKTQEQQIADLKKQVANQVAQADQLKAELSTKESTIMRQRSELKTERTAKTKLTNRIKNGVCPCCNRSFVQLHRHMANQHPDYMQEAP